MLHGSSPKFEGSLQVIVMEYSCYFLKLKSVKYLVTVMFPQYHANIIFTDSVIQFKQESVLPVIIFSMHFKVRPSVNLIQK